MPAHKAPRPALHLLLRGGVGLALCLLTGGAWGGPVRMLLGQYPLPAGEGLERTQNGFLKVGNFLENPDGAASARPDGTGSAYNLYQLFLHDGVRGAKAGFVGDLLLLTDRGSGSKLRVSELDYLLGVAFRQRDLRLQFNREESKPLDRRGPGWRYWDVRGEWEFTRSLGGRVRPPPGRRALDASVGGALGAGWFLHNSGYHARFDRTGKAALRYHARASASAYGGTLFAQGRWITDERGALRPVSMEYSLGVGARVKDAEIRVSREVGDVLDRLGYRAYYVLAFTYHLPLPK